MYKCPKCRSWTAEVSMSESVLKCYNAGCGYQKNIDVDKYLKEHNDLPRLAKSLKLNGYHLDAHVRSVP